ncbi:MAG: hypothetical protein LBB37_01550 [Endomicrobium sp.]|jgi:uncharacterized protein YerC|nr:hypothetical protein [Endomicrobium sp.]
MKDEFEFFDHMGTGNGIETIGDQMRRKKMIEEQDKREIERYQQAKKHEKITTRISLIVLLIAIISLLVSIVK